VRTTEEVENEIRELEALLEQEDSGSVEHQRLSDWLSSLKKLCALMHWRDAGIKTGQLKYRAKKRSEPVQ
jgi:hypothetical protein